jgi:TRAP-type C4-dicarboxylate transport system permease small subunit
MHSSVAAPPAGGALERLRGRYTSILEWAVGTLMVVLAVEVVAGVAFRTIGRPLVWYDEVASILLAWLTFYGSALASAKRAHISCPEVVDQLAPPLRRMVAILVQLLVIGFFVLLGWVGLSIMPVLHTDAMVSLPEVPMSIVQSVIPISAALIVFAEALHLIELVRRGGGRRAAPAAADALH